MPTVNEHIDYILSSGRALLEAARSDRSAWDAFETNLEHDKQEGSLVDRADEARLMASWALEFDGVRDEDESLVRYLLEQEVFWRERSPFQGIGESIRIFIAALARFRRVEDAPLFARAKQANFDTFCGLDRHMVAVAGVRETIAYFRERDGDAATEVLELLVDEDGEPMLDQEDVDHWHLHYTGAEREVIDASMLSLWLDRARWIEEDTIALDLSRKRVDEAVGEQRFGAAKEHADVLIFSEKHAEALDLLRSLMATSEDPRGAGLLARAVEAAAGCGEHDAAAAYLDRLLSDHEGESLSRQERYGFASRRAMELTLEYAPSLGAALAIPLLERVDRLAEEGGHCNFVSFLELAVGAFEEVGRVELLEKYTLALRDERKRLDQLRV